MQASRVKASLVMAMGAVMVASGCTVAGPTMPAVEDQRLDAAYETLEEAGISSSDVETTDASVWMRSNWTVCAQSPQAGTPVSDGVELAVGRQCRDGSAFDPSHLDERRFTGEVTGHHEYSTGELTVDEADVKLDLIEPVGEQDGCYDVSPRLEAAARRAQLKMLPVGTRVLVIRSTDYGDEAFVHLLKGERDVPRPRDPKLSVNERLVREGYWEPDEGSFDGPWDIEGRRYRPRLAAMTSTQSTYGPLIAAAATAARDEQVASYGECLDQLERDRRREERWRQRLEEDEDRDRHWVPGPSYGDGHPCLPGERDGDGDGLCGES